MNGIVIWAATDADKAIIWCADQKGLVYYLGKEPAAGITLKRGDWVAFDIETNPRFRFARALRVVEGEHAGELIDELLKLANPTSED